MSDGKGCGGGAIIAAIAAVALLVGAAFLVKNLADYNDAEASRLYARGALEESYGRSQAEIERAQAEGRAAIISAESQARLNQAVAEAQMVLAQAQARLDSAQAFAVTAGASLPWLVVTVVGIAGVVLLATILAMFGLALAALRGEGGTPRVAILAPRRRALPRLVEETPSALIIDEDVFYQQGRWQGGQ